MAASKDKAILFARATVDKQHHLWPVAVFNDTAGARQHAALLKMAYATGNGEMIHALDPGAVTDPAGNYVPGTKWSVKVVPYAPTIALDASEVEEEASAPI